MKADGRVRRLLYASPVMLAKISGGLYLINIVTSLIAFSGKGSDSMLAASGMTATASYVAVTILLYYLFKPVHAGLSFLAAIFSLAGSAAGVLGRQLVPFHLHSLVFFGCYCLLIAILILRSNFLPKFLGWLMALAGVGWLTFVSPPLADSLSPYHYTAGGIGEGLLTVWLLFRGVDAVRWKQQASHGIYAAGSN